MVKYEQNISIKSMDAADQPREKLLLHGRRHLSDAELLAIIMRSGSRDENVVKLSQRILLAYRNNLSELGKASVKDLSKLKGMGEVKALTIIAALELGRRRKKDPNVKFKQITCSRDAFEVIHPVLADLHHEEFWILMLNSANVVLNKVMISRGGRAGTVADPKVIFKTAMDHEAAYIILAHNHPSGNLKPSEEDIMVTKKLIDAGRVLELYVLDHLIITSGAYCSLMDDGYIA
jgi:DNA repair protein RadC